jgi:hypothetical protein
MLPRHGYEEGKIMNKAILMAVVTGALVALAGCKPEPSIQEQWQASQEKLRAEQRAAIEMLKQRAAGGEKAKP